MQRDRRLAEANMIQYVCAPIRRHDRASHRIGCRFSSHANQTPEEREFADLRVVKYVYALLRHYTASPSVESYH
uniref:GAF domain-containing protein n=1 Tax=Mesocestoides corti TaxID=53468 RepID=A0A5K3F323_MESCO